MCVVFVRKTRMTVVMLQASRDLKQRLITSLLLIAVAGNMTALSALAAHGLVGAVTSDVAGLTAVTAGALVLALAGDVAGLTAVAAHGLVGALASNVADLVAVVAHDHSVASGSTLLATSRYTPHSLLRLRALEGLVTGLAALVAHSLALLRVAGAIASLVAHTTAHVALHLLSLAIGGL